MHANSILHAFLLFLLVGAQSNNDTTNNNNGTTDSKDGGSLGDWFAELTELDLALFVLVGVIIVGLLLYILLQQAKSRTRRNQVRESDQLYALHHLHQQPPSTSTLPLQV